MTRCLRRQALFVVSQGEGLPWQRSHLMRCHRCAERYRAMVGASELAARVLREGPLPERVPQPRSVLRPWPVAVLAATGASLAYSTYLAGTNGSDQANGVAVDSTGKVFVTGTTSATTLPTTAYATAVASGNAGSSFFTAEAACRL